MTDPPQTFGKDNLSLRALVASLNSTAEPSFRAELVAAVDDAERKSDFARQWRNKRLAHTDLPAAAGGVATVLPDLGKSQIGAAIESIGRAMNCAERHYLRSEVGWDVFDFASVGVLSLIHYLRKGRDAQAEADAKAKRR
jgi:hypothetical protein